MGSFLRSYRKYRSKLIPHAGGTSYTPLQIAAAYGFPTNVNGTGQTIAFIELGGGFVQSDFSLYMSSLGIPVPQVDTVLVDGATSTPDGPDGADGEVMLDCEVGLAVAPGAKGKMIFAPNTDAGFVDAIKAAVQSGATIISISWGGPEDSWSAASIKAMEAAFSAAIAAGVTIHVAAGDGGSSDGERGNHCDYPSSSPQVIGCGGTTLMASGNAIQSEVVWNDGSQGGATGGGVSVLFPRPDYQSKISLTGKGRGVPDVAGNADPNTGYIIQVDGQRMVIGGTSAVAPLWAGLTALLNQAAGKNLGSLNSILYGLPANTLRDITSGNNGTYVARVGWDACTGLGTPDGAKLIAALAPPAPPVPPVLVPPPVVQPPTPPVATINRMTLIGANGVELHRFLLTEIPVGS